MRSCDSKRMPQKVYSTYWVHMHGPICTSVMPVSSCSSRMQAAAESSPEPTPPPGISSHSGL